MPFVRYLLLLPLALNLAATYIVYQRLGGLLRSPQICLNSGYCKYFYGFLCTFCFISITSLQYKNVWYPPPTHTVGRMYPSTPLHTQWEDCTRREQRA